MSHHKTKNFLKEHNSPATSYLVSVIEKRAHGDAFHGSESVLLRVTSAFASLDEIIPHCGIYSPILKLIKEEMIEAVYSDTYTTAGATSSDNKSKIERVPYFVLFQRLNEQRSQSSDLLESEIEKHKNKYLQAKKDASKYNAGIVKLEKELKENRNQIKYLMETIRQKDEDVMKLQYQLKNEHSKTDRTISEFSENMKTIETNSKLIKLESVNLRRYKISYDTLKDTFDLPPDKRPRRGFRRPVISTKKTQLLSNIEAASKLEQQIIEVQTKSLEEYDLYLEDVKNHLCSQKFAESEQDPNFFTEELQLENLGDEMSAKLKNFRRLITGAIVELELLRQHRDVLQSQLTQMEQAENIAAGDTTSNTGTLPPSSMAGGPGSTRMTTHDDTGKKTSIESQLSIESGLEEDTTPLVDPTRDPFNPQEKLLSKYSAMIYTSINSGKTFDEIAVAKYCKSCGEKTTICPHKVTKNDMIVSLPSNCTHIKLARPMVRLSMTGAGLAELENFGQSSHGKWHDPIPEHQWEFTGDDNSVRRQLTPLWKDSKRRAGIDINTSSSSICASRDHSLDRVFSLVEQFYASMLWRDEHISEDDDVSTMKEYLYNFMSDRYLEDEISQMATYDLVTAVVKFASRDKIVYVFGLALSGIMDGALVRYINLVADLIDIIEWKQIRDFQVFADILYPFMHEDDMELLVMEYTAFSENKISKTLVMSYIVHIITKSKEPRIMDAEAKLSSVKTKEKGHMTENEFISAMEGISPLARDQLITRLMQETMLTIGSTIVPIKRLAAITGFIVFSQLSPLLTTQIASRMEGARLSKIEEPVSKLPMSKSLVPDTGNLITFSQIRLLATNISRQRQAGNRQSQQSFNDDFY